MPFLDIPFPLGGLNKNQRVSDQPPGTSRDMANAWPQDRTTGRLRGSMRPGMSPYFSGYLSVQGNKVQCLTSTAFQARHISYSADPVPNEMWGAHLLNDPAISAIAAGLYDDFYIVDSNLTLRWFSRYGVEISSITLPAVPTDLVIRAICVDVDGAVYVATSDYVSTSTSLTGSKIWKVHSLTGNTLEIAWHLLNPAAADGTGGIERMFAHEGNLYTLEVVKASPANYSIIRKYANVDAVAGFASGDVTTVISIKFGAAPFTNLHYAFLSTTDHAYPHDMAVRTTPNLEFVVALGNIRNAGAGKWGLAKITGGTAGVWTLNDTYAIASDEATDNNSTPPVNAAAPGLVCGGIGYGCAIDITGNVYSMGRKNVDAQGDDAYFRKITDTTTAWSITGGWNRTQTTDLAGTANYLAYGYPRMALDKYAIAIVPTCRDNVDTAAAKVVRNDGTLFTSIVHYEDTVTPGVSAITHNECRAVAVPTTYPQYQDDDYKITDTVFLAGTAVDTLTTSGSEKASIHGYDILLETMSSVSSRTIANLGVAGGNILRFTSSGTSTPTNLTGRSPVLSATSRLIQAASLAGEVFFTDGADYCVYKPSPPGSVLTHPSGRLVNWNAASIGIIPPRCRLIARWRNRIVLAHSADSPYAWHMSAYGNPYDWDLFPPEVLETQAVSGSALGGAGNTPQVINALVPWSDDLLFFGCDSMILRLDGDPMAGGRMSVVSDQTGMAFGAPWCKDPEGRVYFFGSRGGIYVMSPSGEIQWLTRDTIEEDLADFNLSQNHVELTWNTRDNGLHLWVFPYGAGGTHLTHYFWSQRTGGWFPVEIGSTAYTVIQPTACCVIDGDLPTDREMLVGTEDGRVLKWDPDVATDDGWPIDARVLIGPVAGTEGDMEARFKRPSVMLAAELGGCHLKMFASDTPDVPTIPRSETRIGPGRNERMPIQVRGSYVWFQLRSASRPAAPALSERWALESIRVEAVAAGRKRVRS